MFNQTHLSLTLINLITEEEKEVKKWHMDLLTTKKMEIQLDEIGEF